MNPRRGQAEAIDGGVGQAEAGAALPGGVQVTLVGFDQGGRELDEPLAGRPQPGLFLRPVTTARSAEALLARVAISRQ